MNNQSKKRDWQQKDVCMHGSKLSIRRAIFISLEAIPYYIRSICLFFFLMETSIHFVGSILLVDGNESLFRWEHFSNWETI
jgi:hypothetical protein